MKRGFLLGPSLTWKPRAVQSRPFKQAPQALSWLAESLKQRHIQSTDLLIGIDGGLALWFKLGYQPSFAVGDWDSLSIKQQKRLNKIPHWTLPHQKNRSDLYFAANLALELGAEELICLGVTGGRPDHHLASLLDLAQLALAGTSLKGLQAFGQEGSYIFLSHQMPTWTGSVPFQQLISLFALAGNAQGVTLDGFEYLLHEAVLEPSSLGLSNRAVADVCQVHIRKGCLLIFIPSETRDECIIP